ncbi:MAG: four-carbon acid sugar kinase family protein, partial [Sphaerochaetaceae bacterium]|nr:four-carbon acid sugar kinase family protein [Sphaerochaetaceae bacterium]
MGKLGVIADDFTGATDIAGFLADGNVNTIQTNGIPTKEIEGDAQAIVVSLKTRSCPKESAVRESLQALEWLKSQGCDQFYFKYCSTFDSSSEGNIGPVTDALMEALGEKITLVCPSLPVNGRTVYKGYLFVNNELLSESGMRYHPITPMLDSKVFRLMKAQSKGEPYEIFLDDVEKGPDYIASTIRS